MALLRISVKTVENQVTSLCVRVDVIFRALDLKISIWKRIDLAVRDTLTRSSLFAL